MKPMKEVFELVDEYQDAREKARMLEQQLRDEVFNMAENLDDARARQLAAIAMAGYLKLPFPSRWKFEILEGAVTQLRKR